MSVTTGAFMILIAWAAIRSRRMVTDLGLVGGAQPIGASGEVRLPLAPIGTVYVAGEEWSATTPDHRPLQRGTPVRIIRIDGLTAVVEPEPGPSPSA